MRNDGHRGSFARRVAAIALLAWGCAGDATTGAGTRPLLSEQDDRKETYETEFPWMRSLAEYGTAALVDQSYVTTATLNGWSYTTLQEGSQTLGQLLNLCPGERFADQRVTSFCTGTLIDNDLVLTSGSCLTGAHTCANTRFVFNHYNTAPGEHALVMNTVYSCAEVVVQQNGDPNLGEPNFAVVRLNSRVVPVFQPVPLRTARGPLDPGQHVKLVGHPYGIPAKIDAQGNVVNNALRPNYFLASLDTFAGEYGGGVYESDHYTLAGILTGHVLRAGSDPALADYHPVTRPDGTTCNVATACSDPMCGTAAVLSVGAVLDALCADPTRSERLCGNAAPENDSCLHPATLPLGYDVTVTGSTLNALPEVVPSCSSLAQRAPDVWYYWHVDVPLVLYVDAFTSDFPVLLHLIRGGCNTANTIACNGNACGTGQGQIAAYLQPDTYYLGVTGRGGTSGHYNLHIQTVGGSFRAERIQRGARTVSGTDLGSVYGGRTTCGGAPSGGVLYYYTTCPDYRGGAVRATTCGRASWDTVLTFAQGNARALACADDTCGDQSTLRATASPGSGLRGLYLDAIGTSGPYSLFYSIP